ncbi:hypothetical protein DH2020_044799 [Rehmannia glutinosa]|uniref:DDE Tnp4 domain-containing protein n=1 Tax=Rehmannia glutinosa TaxID=99300 RepID=A0ABR0UFX6_REHGL
MQTCRATRLVYGVSVAIFLTTIGFASRQRTTCERFQHSLEIVSRHVKKVAKRYASWHETYQTTTCKYYLVDSGFCNFPGFLAPYRQHRYHINAWRGAMFDPRGPEELFNKRHSRLRNAIERAFGVLKGRFPILKGPMPRYSIRRQVNIVIACCVLHNWLRANYQDDEYFRRSERGEFDRMRSADDARQIPQQSQQDIVAQSEFRDMLAASMWARRR